MRIRGVIALSLMIVVLKIFVPPIWSALQGALIAFLDAGRGIFLNSAAIVQSLIPTP